MPSSHAPPPLAKRTLRLGVVTGALFWRGLLCFGVRSRFLGCSNSGVMERRSSEQNWATWSRGDSLATSWADGAPVPSCCSERLTINHPELRVHGGVTSACRLGPRPEEISSPSSAESANKELPKLALSSSFSVRFSWSGPNRTGVAASSEGRYRSHSPTLTVGESRKRVSGTVVGEAFGNSSRWPTKHPGPASCPTNWFTDPAEASRSSCHVPPCPDPHCDWNRR